MAIAVGEDSGYPNLRVVTYPGVIQTHELETIRKNVEKGLADEIARVLTTPVEKTGAAARETDEREVVFRGTLDEVNRHFQKRLWSDGLPIIPPTLKKVEEFLKYTDRSPSEVLGVLPPRNG